MVRTVVPFVLILVCVFTVRGQEVGLTSSAGKSQLRLGEPVTVTVTARISTEIDTIGPAVSDSLGMFEILASREEESGAVWVFELMSIDTGQVFMAPIPFRYLAAGDTVARTAYTNSLMFTVRGFEVPEGADIKDIKPPMNAPWRWGDIWPYLLVLALAAGAWFVYKRYFRKTTSLDEASRPLGPPVAPDVRALRELRALEEKKLWERGMSKEYYSECTEIIRRFFEGRFGFPALELTTFETLQQLRRREALSRDEERIRAFFDRADLVKFAKMKPTPADNQEELRAAYDIVKMYAPEPAVQKEESLAG